MSKKVEKSAKSLNEALEAAAEELGVAVDKLDYEVLREMGKGFFGRLLTGKEVIISAWVKTEKETPKNKPNKERKEKSEVKAEKPQAAEKAQKTENTEKQESTSKPASSESDDAPSSSPNRSGRKIASVVPPEAVVQARDFAAELLRLMGFEGINLNVKIGNNGSTIDIDVSGEKMGLLIGKRGDTINAVQYLTSLYVNHGRNEYIKVNIDTENYRKKREETLVRLAKSLERRAVREKKNITLEPMSANERRIIHATLQNNPNVTTYSVGNEPNRKIVVALKKQ